MALRLKGIFFNIFHANVNVNVILRAKNMSLELRQTLEAVPIQYHILFLIFPLYRIPSFDYAALQAKTLGEMYFGAWSKSWLLSLWCSIIERGNTLNSHFNSIIYWIYLIIGIKKSYFYGNNLAKTSSCFRFKRTDLPKYSTHVKLKKINIPKLCPVCVTIILFRIEIYHSRICLVLIHKLMSKKLKTILFVSLTHNVIYRKACICTKIVQIKQY
ncbi:hypothetical protein BpHYR1_020613 [Brachionus plicatilis]|uniref:Uncharacterized protein n=1 Tax=Brachionus plicatilis TaxID=10195 RepID=A0A3M7PQK0_BRAPC|nr:hypothetical protein BpHYR1_020613 [Brachionus plicatilis]